jgi:hypothetical protein
MTGRVRASESLEIPVFMRVCWIRRLVKTDDNISRKFTYFNTIFIKMVYQMVYLTQKNGILYLDKYVGYMTKKEDISRVM